MFLAVYAGRLGHQAIQLINDHAVFRAGPNHANT
jgi:hypothetical protein